MQCGGLQDITPRFLEYCPDKEVVGWPAFTLEYNDSFTLRTPCLSRLKSMCLSFGLLPTWSREGTFLQVTRRR